MTSANGSYLLLTNKIPSSMKLTALSLMLSLSAFAANADAQQVSVTVSNAKVKTVLNSISDQTGLSLAYSAQVVDLNRKVSLNFVNTEVSEVLNAMFGNTAIGYEIKDGKIYLFKAAERTTTSINQQKRIITGTVVDPNGEAVIGANVVVKGTTNGTITDMDGKFSLEVPEGAMLLVSYIGYGDYETKVGNQSNLSITLKEDSQALDELVVVGYGTMKKKDLTGAVGAVKGESLAARKTTQLSSALQGAVAGVTVTRPSGSPDATGTIRVRGVTTIGDNNPLVIIDGIPGSLNDVNANDVESMSVLKDAASSAIYGSRAAAGVILITTKRAKEGALNLNYSYEYGMDILLRNPENVGAVRYMQVANEQKYNDNPSGGMYQQFSQDRIENYYQLHAEDPNKYPITDWNDVIFEKTAPRQSHSLSIAGGSKSVKTNISLTYDKTDGQYYNRYYERLMLRTNNDIKINKWLEAKLDFNFKRAKNHSPGFLSPFTEATLIEQTRYLPAIWCAIRDDGKYGFGRDGGNPYKRLHESGNKDEWYNQIGGRIALGIHPLEGLKLSAIISPPYHFNKLKTFRKASNVSAEDNPDIIISTDPDLPTTKLVENRNDNYNVTKQFLINYTKAFGKHDFDVMLGYEDYYAFYENLMASRDQYELDNYPYLNIGPLAYRDNSGSAQEVAYRSWFGRIAYNYDNRYLLQANLRRDGSSRFASDYRWGNFPSFSAGWVMSEETFMKDLNLNWLSFLKLRGSYGTLGNERILDSSGNQNYYPYQAAMGFGNMLFFQNGQPISQLTAAQQYYAIQNISWEKTKTYDIGLDANFLDNRLRFTFDYYKKTTEDMLLALEIPDYVGFDNPQQNTGDMYTKGYDIEVGWSDQMGDFTYSISANFSDYVSRMGNLGGTEFLGDNVKIEGSEFNEWYGYLSDGLMLTEEDLQGPKLNDNVQLGDVKYKDISGPDGKPDGKITPEYDRVLLGGSLPRFLYGGNIALSYKEFDLTFAFQGVGRQNVRYIQQMTEPCWNTIASVPSWIDGNFWSSYNTTEQNAAAKFPRVSSTSSTANYGAMSDLWLFNGRYFRVKNITLGYILPTTLTNKIMIKRARVYVSANDILTVSQFPKGWDPEITVNTYPITASVLFGLSVNF